jgi:SAM-dependent methyltransferase
MSRSKSYIFQKDDDGSLSLVGDFEGYYQNNEDPWDQTSNTSDMADYYNFSRNRLLKCINTLDKKSKIIEVGCGLGIVTRILKDNLAESDLVGIDISSTAISKANEKYSDIEFMVGDVSSLNFKYEETADIVILNQMLWYILENLDLAIDNVYEILNDNGYLIISMAFLNEQKYGKEIIDGFQGLIEYCDKVKDKFELIDSDFDESKKFDYNDGIICLKKRKLEKGK